MLSLSNSFLSHLKSLYRLLTDDSFTLNTGRFVWKKLKIQSKTVHCKRKNIKPLGKSVFMKWSWRAIYSFQGSSFLCGNLAQILTLATRWTKKDQKFPVVSTSTSSPNVPGRAQGKGQQCTRLLTTIIKVVVKIKSGCHGSKIYGWQQTKDIKKVPLSQTSSILFSFI